MTQPVYRKTSDPIQALAERISRLESAIRSSGTPQSFNIPILAVDPDESDPTNAWVLPDGRLRVRHRNTAGTAWVYREFVATAPGSDTSSTPPAPAAPAPITRQTEWPATWSQSYRQSGAARTDQGETFLYYGSSGDGFNGRNRSLIGFDYGNIAATLSGSTINQVWLRLQNIHAYWKNGADIHFGIHAFTGEPATWTGAGIPASMISKHHFGKADYRTVLLPLSFATSIRDGAGTGVALESPSDSREFYGYAAGVGSGHNVPTLIVNYAK